MTWLGLMPLRAGSKSIPHKNLRKIAGRPLFAWSLEQALASRVFDALVVATDSDAIRRAVQQEFGSAVEVIGRSPASATDTADSESVMLEVCSAMPCAVMALIQATSPLTRAEHFRAARSLFCTGGLDSLLTGVRSKRFIWSDQGQPLNYNPTQRPRRQDYAGVLVENGAFYYTRVETLLNTRCRIGGKVGIFEMPPQTVTELDEPEDIALVTRLLAYRARNRLPHNHPLRICP